MQRDSVNRCTVTSDLRFNDSTLQQFNVPKPFVVKKIQPTIFQRFFRTETAGGSVLLLFGIAALVLANSPFAEAYERLWQVRLTVGIGERLAVADAASVDQRWADGGVFSVGRIGDQT